MGPNFSSGLYIAMVTSSSEVRKLLRMVMVPQVEEHRSFSVCTETYTLVSLRLECSNMTVCVITDRCSNFKFRPTNRLTWISLATITPFRKSVSQPQHFPNATEFVLDSQHEPTHRHLFTRFTNIKTALTGEPPHVP